MSRYSFRKPTIGQEMDMYSAITKGDMGRVARLLNALTTEDILDLPFTEMVVVAQDYGRAMDAWREAAAQDDLPEGMVDFLAELSARESTEEEDD